MHQDGYARLFAAHPRFRVVAVVDEPGQEAYIVERNRSLARQHGVPYKEDLDALADPDVHVVSVGAQIERRARLATAAARCGKHLWLDKPPVVTVQEAAVLADAVESAGVKSLVVSFNAAAWAEALHASIAAGAIGEMLALHLDFHFAKGDTRGLNPRRVPSGTESRDVWTFRDPDGVTDPTESGHNVVAKRELFEMGWYPLALARRVCPQAVTRVFACAGAYFFAGHRELGLEDFASVVLTTTGPAISFSVGRVGRRSAATGSRLSVRAVGTRGALVVDGGLPALTLHGGPQGAGGSRSPSSESAGLDRLLNDFSALLDGGPIKHATASQCAGLVRILEAAYDSAGSGRAVPLTPGGAEPTSLKALKGPTLRDS